MVLQVDTASSSAQGVTNPLDSTPTPSLELRIRERKAAIANALGSLDPVTGTVLELSFFHNLSLQAIVQPAGAVGAPTMRPYCTSSAVQSCGAEVSSRTVLMPAK